MVMSDANKVLSLSYARAAVAPRSITNRLARSGAVSDRRKLVSHLAGVCAAAVSTTPPRGARATRTNLASSEHAGRRAPRDALHSRAAVPARAAVVQVLLRVDALDTELVDETRRGGDGTRDRLGRAEGCVGCETRALPSAAVAAARAAAEATAVATAGAPAGACSLLQKENYGIK